MCGVFRVTVVGQESWSHLMGAIYRAILEENLLEAANDLRLGRRLNFQQDNDPEHTVKKKSSDLRKSQN